MNPLNLFRWLKRKINKSEKTSYALDELDLRLEPFLDFRNGFFVEAGANDGIKQSNTLYFEKYKGWTGLLIEPIPELANKCQKNRPNSTVEHAALVADDYPDEKVELRYCDLMSVVKGGLGSEEEEINHVKKGKEFLRKEEEIHQVKSPAMTLSSIFDKNDIQEVDLLSLDVEGYEVQSLKGIDFRRHRPEYMIIEVRDVSDIKEVIGDYYDHIATLSVHGHRKDMLFKSI